MQQKFYLFIKKNSPFETYFCLLYIVWNLDKCRNADMTSGYLTQDNIYHHYLVLNQFQHFKKERKIIVHFLSTFIKKNTLFPLALIYGGRPCVWNWKNKLVNCISIELKTPSWSKLVTYIHTMHHLKPVWYFLKSGK